VTWTDPSGRSADAAVLKLLDILIAGGSFLAALILTQTQNIDLTLDININLSSTGVANLRPRPRGVSNIGAEVAAAAATAVATVIRPGVLTEQQVMDMTAALAVVCVKLLDHYRFFEASLDRRTGMLTIGRALTFNEASKHIGNIRGATSTHGVFAFSVTDALWLAHEHGGISYNKGSFDHSRGRPGFFPHLHPVNSPGAHIWFLGLNV